MTTLLDLTTRYGEPVYQTERYAAFECCYKGWPSLRYEWATGYLKCANCGLFRRLGKADENRPPAWKGGAAFNARLLKAPAWTEVKSQGGRAYLASRGMTEAERASWWVEDPSYPGYVICPLYEDGVLVSWQGRAWDGKEPRYKSAESARGWMPTRNTCFGLDRIQPGQKVYVTEGVFDALYFPTGVAVLGKEPSELQVVKILDRCPSEVVVLPDSDNESGPWFKVFAQMGRAVPCVTLTRGWAGTPLGDWKDYGDLVARGERFKG